MCALRWEPPRECVHPAGVSRRGGSLAGPELAGSRTLRPASPYLGAPLVPFRPRYRRVPDSLIHSLSRSAQPCPLDPDVWQRVLAEAEVPGRDTIVAGIRHGVPLSLEDVPYPRVHVPNHPMLYLDLPRVKEAVEEEVRNGRYVKVPPSVDPTLLNLSAMGVAPRFKSFEARRAFETYANTLRPILKRAALDDFEDQPVSDGPGLSALGGLAAGVRWRVIHDLTHPDGENVNSFAESPYFALPTALNFARQLKQNSFIWKGDIDKAFRNVPVRQRDWPLLAFHVDGILFVDTRLPFGHVLSPYYFVDFVGRPVQYVAVRRGATLLGALESYIDDFFGGCDTYEKALEQMQLWLQVCADLGVPVSKAKTFLPAQVVEILGFIINTVHMTISVDRERIQDILHEMKHIEGRKAVQKNQLERLAGKMVFVCSVVPGGRTFMREILDTLNRLSKKTHWAHLSAGFRADLAWWQKFALGWNGVESIPPPVSIPWRWLTSDASGGEGIGVFCCGAGIFMPLVIAPGTDRTEADLIIAETELVAAVLLVACAGPLFGGEHLLLGVDNQVAISWIASGTASRPRAMRALRILWRLQALYRVHVSTRYIRSADNVLADAASRRDVPAFSRACASWELTHGASLREYKLETYGRTSLLATPYGPAGGAAGLLVQFLVEGHNPRVLDSESQVERILCSFSTHARRFVAQEHCRLRHLPRNYRQDRRDFSGVQLDQSLRGLLGASEVLYASATLEPSAASRSAAVPPGSGAVAGEEGRQGGAVPAGSHSSAESSGSDVAERRGAADGGLDCDSRILGLSPPGDDHSQVGREAAAGAGFGRRPDSGNVPPYHGASIENDPVCRTLASNRGASPGRSALVPIESIRPMDLDAATSILPDDIVRAVYDESYHALAFSIPEPRESNCPFIDSAHGSFIQERVCPPRLCSRCANLASDAPRRLEIARGCNVLCRRCADSESAGWRFNSQPVGVGDDPPN